MTFSFFFGSIIILRSGAKMDVEVDINSIVILELELELIILELKET